MKRTASIVGVLGGLALVVGLSTCPPLASAPEKPETKKAQAAKPAEPKKLDPAFLNLVKTTQQKFQAAKDPQAAGRDAVKQFRGYIDKHPRTVEADNARLIVAELLGSVLDDTEGSVAELKKVAGEARDPEMRLQARAMTVGGLINLGKFDEAETLLKNLAQEKSNPQIQAFARANLERLPKAKALAKGATPPDFSEKDLSGNDQSLAKHRGKVLLVDFWASWCPPCRAEMPNVKATYDKYHDQGFEILGISLDQKIEDARKYAEDEKIRWPLIADGKYWEAKLAQAYGIQAIPATLLLDKKGVIRYKDLRGPALEKAVATLLAEK